MSKLLPNLPIENLTLENDYIGIIEKGTLLKSFFLNNKHEFAEIKIFSIYGEWGSGKSTLMKYLQKELTGSFNTFFFESWEFESDNNLANSLLEFLTKETDSKADELLKNGSKLLEGFAKSTTFKTPFANFNMNTLVNEVDKPSFLELKDNFKSDFENWENKITTKDKSPDYNIVFIDDLDRCEPENILNLLSAMKLFFTYGKKTIFLCGIDKKAIREAVINKYGDVVKSNEYLEKIFDISFSMPANVDASKLINLYFEDDEKVGDKKLGDLIIDFFDKLHFKNPRRIKKILNKYLILKRLKQSVDDENIMLPNIIFKNSGTLFETYLTFYLLILNEFEPDIFLNVFDLGSKKVNYNNVLERKFKIKSEYDSAKREIIGYFNNGLISKKFKDYSNNDFSNIKANIYPVNVDDLSLYIFRDATDFLKYFNLKKKNLEYRFTYFYLFYEDELKKDFSKSNFSLLNYRSMISNLI